MRLRPLKGDDRDLPQSQIWSLFPSLSNALLDQMDPPSKDEFDAAHEAIHAVLHQRVGHDDFQNFAIVIYLALAYAVYSASYRTPVAPEDLTMSVEWSSVTGRLQIKLRGVHSFTSAQTLKVFTQIGPVQRSLYRLQATWIVPDHTLCFSMLNPAASLAI
ncbi:MAG: hypothetical protein JKY23_06080 [Nitrospinaceae bacterium]|nr:hypothetical protein [Nitrospinaceae bacterium]